MKRWPLTIILLLIIGCAPRQYHKLMDLSPQTVGISRPEVGKALVIFGPHFVGPSGAFSGSGVIYDGPDLVGVSGEGTALAYQAVPGRHRFMVVSKEANFMDADLVAGKTYYVLVEAYGAGYTLDPLDPRQDVGPVLRYTPLSALSIGGGYISVILPSAGDWQDCRIAVPTERTRQWDRRNQGSIAAKREKYESAWLAKPDAERPYLRPEFGR